MSLHDDEIAHIVACRMFGADIVKKVYTDDTVDSPKMDTETPVENGLLSYTNWTYGAVVIEFINGRKIMLGKNEVGACVLSLLDAERWKISAKEIGTDDNGNRLSLMLGNAKSGGFFPTFSETLHAIRHHEKITGYCEATEILERFFSPTSKLNDTSITAVISMTEYTSNQVALFMLKHPGKIVLMPTT